MAKYGTIQVNYIRTSESGKAVLCLVNGKEEAWIPISQIENYEEIDWGGFQCEINVNTWWLQKAGVTYV